MKIDSSKFIQQLLNASADDIAKMSFGVKQAKIIRAGNADYIHLPKAYINAAGLKPGDVFVLIWGEEGRVLRFIPKKDDKDGSNQK